MPEGIDLELKNRSCLNIPFYNEEVLSYRFMVNGNSAVRNGSSSNAGMACYILEMLCESEQIAKFSCFDTWRIKLARQVIKQAVMVDGVAFWKWEAHPSRPDYNYPFDWDDTCKAIDSLLAFERLTGRRCGLILPGPQDLLNRLELSLYSSSKSGEEVKVTCRYRTALHMFMANKKEKPNNTEDIFVTAVVVRSLVRNYWNTIPKIRQIAEELCYRIFEAGKDALIRRVPFPRFSRCYLSWSRFFCILLDIVHILKSFNGPAKEMIEMYLRQDSLYDFLPTELAPFLWQDELAGIRTLSIATGRPIANLINRKYTFQKSHPQFFYHHRRLNSYYGSPALSWIWNVLTMNYQQPTMASGYSR